MDTICHIFRERSITYCLIPSSLSIFCFYSKVYTYSISIIHELFIHIQPWKFISPFPQGIKVCHIFASYIIFLIFWISFTMTELSKTIIWLRSHDMNFQSRSLTPRTSIFIVFLSILYFIMFFSFWFQLKDITNCSFVQ